jgi:UDP-glucose 4-epimerase
MIATPEADARLCSWATGRAFCVVGGTGVIGRALVSQLRRLGGEVVVFSRQSNADPAIEWCRGDLDESDFSLRTVSAGATIFHLASRKHVGDGARQAERYFETNARGTWRLLEAGRQARAAQMIYASTGLAYGVPKSSPIGEDHPTEPISVYAASKLAGEAAVRGYAGEFALRSVIARLANVYADAPDPETICGRIVGLAASSREIEIRNPHAERDYIHADDAAEGLIRLAALDTREDCVTVNLSTGVGTTAGRLAAIVADEALAATGRKPGISSPASPPPERVPSLILSNQRLAQLTGWKPRIGIEDGLRRCLRLALDSQNS